MSPVKAYKIRQRSTGLFYGPSRATPFTKRGKTWGSLGHAKLAFECNKRLMVDCEIVEYETQEACTYRPTEKYVPTSRWNGKTRVWMLNDPRLRR
jgi:hypothetical protein